MMNKKFFIRSILKRFKKELKQINGDNLKKVILFGSQARGKVKKDSDIDVVLIFQKEPSVKIKKRIREISNSLSLEHDVVIAEFLVTQYEFQKYKTPFLLNVKREGVVL